MKTKWKIIGSAVLALGLGGAALYVANAAPSVPPISTGDAGVATRPYVIKLHAQWCPVCLMTKGVWSKVQEAYAGRVNMVVFDFTSKATTEASLAEAKRLGLEAFFNENSGVSGSVAVLDGRTKEVKDSLHGNRDLADYRTAIDAVLKNTAK